MTEDNRHCSGCGHDHNHDEGCGCGHDHDLPVLHITLEDGTELDCHVLTTYEVDGKRYMALAPVGHPHALLYEYSENEDGISLSNIEDETEFEKVAERFNELLEEADDEE